MRASDPDGGTITSVALQIEDGDADAGFEATGTATRVGTIDTRELKWDQSAHAPANDVDTTPAPSGRWWATPAPRCRTSMGPSPSAPRPERWS